MKGLKNFLRKFENAISAATFAEAGEFETARKILIEEEYKNREVTKKKTESSKPVILKPRYL